MESIEKDVEINEKNKINHNVSITNNETFFNGPFKPKHTPCLPIHFQPPREIFRQPKLNPWFPTMRSVSNICYKQTADMIDKQPPKPLPVYKKINLKATKK